MRFQDTGRERPIEWVIRLGYNLYQSEERIRHILLTDMEKNEWKFITSSNYGIRIEFKDYMSMCKFAMMEEIC